MKVMGLVGGSMVELPKDCDCLPEIHEGPHWMHADKTWHESNLKLLKRDDYLGGIAFAQQEGARLREKIYQMESRGIERYTCGIEDFAAKKEAM
jgi:hypothetical protein